MNEKTLAVFENYKIRRHYDEKTEIWYFSVVDVDHGDPNELMKEYEEIARNLIATSDALKNELMQALGRQS